MSRVHNFLRRSGPFFAGIMIGLSGVTPVFAATLDEQLTPRNLILFGSLVLLCIGIVLKLMERRRTSTGATPEGPDLRWWTNPGTE